ncbi:MAG: hypothetical protein H8D47_02840 [Planctomycetes bacterium]|nr:hypothetical protein [Planctomycetota bacterium]
MIIYNRLFLVILNFVCVGINVTAFFLVVRAVLLWKEILWLKPFDDAGKTLVNSYTKIIDRLWSRMAQRHLALKGKLLIGLILLELSRILVTGLARLL